MIKKVQAYQTSDNRTHNTKLEALKHQFEIDLRAIFQTAITGNPSNFTTVAAAKIIREQGKAFRDLINSYNPKIIQAEREESEQRNPLKTSLTVA